MNPYNFFIHEILSFCTDDMCRKLMSVFVVGIRFLEVFKCQYPGILLLVLAGGLFGSYCVSCNTFVYGAIRFSDSIFMYFLVPDFVKYL